VALDETKNGGHNMVTIVSWTLVWVVMGQTPIVLPDFKTETECRQVVEDVLKQIPKKRKAPQRHGYCVPLAETEMGSDDATSTP
jgi:hypothetical protein